MRDYFIRIEIPEGRVKEILDELTAAQETIYKCYGELTELGIVTIIEKPSEATNGNSKITLEEFEKFYNEMKAKHSIRDKN